MDGASKEKAKVLEFKAAVKRHSKTRRRSKNLSRTEMSLPGMSPSVSVEFTNGQTADEELMLKLATDVSAQTQGPITYSDPVDPQAVDLAWAPTHTPFFPLPTPGYDDNAMDGHVFDETAFQGRLDFDPLGHLPATLHYNSDHAERTSSMTAVQQSNPFPILKTGPDDKHLSPRAAHSRDNHHLNASTKSLMTNSKLLRSGPGQCNICIGSFREQSIPLASIDRAALQYYVETVFPSQFSFLDAATARLVAHDLSELAGRSEICLAATLAQSVYCQNSELDRIGLDTQASFEQVAISYENVSQEGLQEVLSGLGPGLGLGDELDSHSESRIVEAQVCAALLMLSKTNRRDGSWPEVLKLIALLPAVDFSRLSDSHLSSLSLFQDALICLDILACVSTQLEPKFALKFRHAFQEGSQHINLQQAIGCDNAVMECIMKIAELRTWKQRQTSSESMSLIELARRAMRLDRSLHEARQNIRRRMIMTTTTTTEPCCPKPTVDAGLIISNVYVCAASVYLHVSVSGPHPEIVEIKQAVVDTIEAIRCVPRAGLLKRLPWPVCIAASMAEGDDRSFYEQLARGLAESFGSGHSVLRAWSVVSKCWRLRRFGLSGKKSYDWIDAMSSLGDPVFLGF